MHRVHELRPLSLLLPHGCLAVAHRMRWARLPAFARRVLLLLKLLLQLLLLGLVLLPRVVLPKP